MGLHFFALSYLPKPANPSVLPYEPKKNPHQKKAGSRFCRSWGIFTQAIAVLRPAAPSSPGPVLTTSFRQAIVPAAVGWAGILLMLYLSIEEMPMIRLGRRGFLQRVAGVAAWSFLSEDSAAPEPILSSKEVSMPEFGSPFAGMKADRKLTKAELIRAIRFMVAAEYEAVQLYMQLAESIDDKLAKEVLVDIADEERVHAGEFLRVLKHLAPDEEKFYKEGEDEVEEIIEKRGLR